ncbi:MAG: hypothetical protein H6797_04000 [Candidatus Nomurabacteria bacterium]|nr:MAG: hypothetical protein H6797_04000 [Candidatus Nomurabacteria bacterium]
MTKAATVSIDGQEYDAKTGLPVSAESKTSPHHSSVRSSHVVGAKTPAKKLHSTTRRSMTLRRQALKRPVPAKHAITGHKPVKHMDIARPQQHAKIHRFAPHPVGALKPKPKSMDIGPVVHPHVAKAHAASAAKAQPLARSLTASEIKNEAIKNAIANTHKRPSLKSKLRPRQRVMAVLSATLAIVLLAGYVTYLNMPSLSVRVAAVQAGIDANYPEYRPDGYSLNGPVTYSSGEVSMNFKANGSSLAFKVNQSKSSWDSNAVLDNYITPRAGSNYVPYTERGLTIYTYGTNAAWVNGGILYTIEGNAPLSSSQIRHIATSLL